MAIRKLAGYAGIGIEYTQTKNPFFEALVLENMRKIEQLKTGKTLLQLIAQAKPKTRDKNFPVGVNVVFRPPFEKILSAPGMKRSFAGGMRLDDPVKYDAWKNKNQGQLIPTLGAKTSAEPTTKQGGAEHSPSVGCTCWVNYSNIEILSKDGTWHVPHIAMAHEMIHCWHSLNGLSNPDMRQEEYQTVGIKGFDSLPVTENKIRFESGIQLRTKYFADD